MASSSPSVNCWKHDVFLSFRGIDTRYNFTNHLYHGLCRRGINTFIDNKLERGEEITDALIRVIEGSRISIIVLSENYASSTYCLDELVKILDCRRSKKQVVLPIFYKVDPTEVEEQTGRFGIAFGEHDARLSRNLEKVQMWRLALAEVANLSGWHLPEDREEAKVIQGVVEQVLTKLNLTFLHVAEHPVGLDSHVKDVICMLGIGSNDKTMVGICGIGGIGKTTIAKAVYNKIANQFEGSCFLENVREKSKQCSSVVKLQGTLLFEIFGDKRISIGNFDRGINEIRNRLCSKKVLIVIDDVDHVDQLRRLVGGLDWFGEGSRIIITTRDERLLTVHGVERVYRAKELSGGDALVLFSWHAFRKPEPVETYVELAQEVVQYAKGLPLALVVLGSFLYGRSVPEWDSELDKLKNTPNKEVHDILKISFDGLDDHDKAIFLDIACFFKGMDKNYVMKVLEACGQKPVIGVQVLIEKSLISIENNKFQMHDLLQSMGRQVVLEESNVPSRRSRLWFDEDVLHVLTDNLGSDEIEGIMLDSRQRHQIHLSAEAFVKMKRLRILIIRNADCSGVPVNFPNALRWLEWPGYPSSSMPCGFQGRKLVVLNMHHSSIQQFGTEFKNYNFLKFMDFSDCEFLTATPDFSGIRNLEWLKFEGCTNLVEVHGSLGCLGKLEFLSLEFCPNLKKLPSSFRLRSLLALLLSGCNNLEAIPDFVGDMSRMERLSLNGTAIKVLPSSIGNLTGLKTLTATYCKSLFDIPSSIYSLRNLELLLFEGCSKLNKFPQVQSSSPLLISFHSSFSGHLTSAFLKLRCLDLQKCNLLEVNFLTVAKFSKLKDLDLSGNQFVSLPSSISLLTCLTSLKLSRCKNLLEIPSLPPNIKRLEARDCELLERYLPQPRPFQSKKVKSNRLHSIDFSNCHKLATTQGKTLGGELLSQGVLGSLRLEMLLPGSEIPEVFSYRCEGDSLSFQVPLCECENIIGFAICAVVCQDDGVTANISCDVLVDGENVSTFSRQFFLLKSDHLWLFHRPCKYTRSLHANDIDSVHFEVSFRGLGDSMGLALKSFGVHPYKRVEVQQRRFCGYVNYLMELPVCALHLSDGQEEKETASRLSQSLSYESEFISLDLEHSCQHGDLELNLHPGKKKRVGLPCPSDSRSYEPELLSVDPGKKKRVGFLCPSDSRSYEPELLSVDPGKKKQVGFLCPSDSRSYEPELLSVDLEHNCQHSGLELDFRAWDWDSEWYLDNFWGVWDSELKLFW